MKNRINFLEVNAFSELRKRKIVGEAYDLLKKRKKWMGTLRLFYNTKNIKGTGYNRIEFIAAKNI